MLGGPTREGRVPGAACCGACSQSLCGAHDSRFGQFHSQEVNKSALGQDGGRRSADILAGREGALHFTELKFGNTSSGFSPVKLTQRVSRAQTLTLDCESRAAIH